jgi:alpha,alpha-trehalase
LRDGRLDQARDIVDDAVYEVIHFGKVLDANRTYSLGRSQPPLLTRMIRAVYDATHDRAWLAGTLPAIRAQYRYWTREPHLAGKTGLSRYHALGSGPAPEVQAGERDAAGRTHYDRMLAALRSSHDVDFDPAPYYRRRSGRLTALAYVADRSVRESGFDPGDRFGPFSLGILDYAPVCLNSLLFVMERDLAEILTTVGDVFESQTWLRLAEQRRRRMTDVLWDESHGLFVDYDFVRGRRRWYPFATAFFPLWAGLAAPAEARRIAATALPLLERPGGLMTSASASESQRDAPFGEAPLQLIAVEGLRRYGMNAEADRVALGFLGTVLKEYAEHGAVFQKYDVERRESDVSAGIRFGDSPNEIGFGWTNGVFVELEAGLTPARRASIVAAAN